MKVTGESVTILGMITCLLIEMFFFTIVHKAHEPLKVKI